MCKWQHWQQASKEQLQNREGQIHKRVSLTYLGTVLQKQKAQNESHVLKSHWNTVEGLKVDYANENKKSTLLKTSK